MSTRLDIVHEISMVENDLDLDQLDQLVFDLTWTWTNWADWTWTWTWTFGFGLGLGLLDLDLDF